MTMNSKHVVLIIDDNPTHLELYRMIVEKAGFRGLPVLVSYGGIELPSESVDAVLLDCKLGPHMSSYDAVMKVRAQYPAVPILLLAEMYESPADTAPYVHGYVRKGNPEELQAALQGVLKKEN